VDCFHDAFLLTGLPEVVEDGSPCRGSNAVFVPAKKRAESSSLSALDRLAMLTNVVEKMT